MQELVAAVREAARYDGKWVLETNDDRISLEDATLGYKGLLVIERCFRTLKRTQIKMMPMFHGAPRRIEAHVKKMECRESEFSTPHLLFEQNSRNLGFQGRGFL